MLLLQPGQAIILDLHLHPSHPGLPPTVLRIAQLPHQESFYHPNVNLSDGTIRECIWLIGSGFAADRTLFVCDCLNRYRSTCESHKNNFNQFQIQLLIFSCQLLHPIRWKDSTTFEIVTSTLHLLQNPDPHGKGDPYVQKLMKSSPQEYEQKRQESLRQSVYHKLSLLTLPIVSTL